MRDWEDDILFQDGELSNILDQIKNGIPLLVDGIPKDQFLSNSVEDIITHISDKVILTPLVLFEDQKTMENREIRIDVSKYPDRNVMGERGPIYVPGVRVIVSIPYTGTDDLWRLCPSSYQSIFPRGLIYSPNAGNTGHLDISFALPNDENLEKIKDGLNRSLQNLQFFIEAQRKQIEQHNSLMPELIKKYIESRKQRLKQHDNLTDLLEIPLKLTGKPPSIKPLEIKHIIHNLNPAPKSGYKPEPGILQKVYEDILNMIRHVGRTFETTPKTYSVHDEEELRDIILANLNGLFKGAASGEAFRKSGKTDIKIESEDRSAFVGECKVWNGAKEILSAVDQLLGYLIWRDCKAALIIFNKHNTKFSEILEELPKVLQSHSRMNKFIGSVAEGEWDYIFMSKEDDGRLIHVRVFIFNIFTK